MNDLKFSVDIAQNICNIINKEKSKKSYNTELSDVFDYSIGKSYIKIGLRHYNSNKLYSAQGFLEISTNIYYPSGGWNKPNKKYPKVVTNENINEIAMRIAPQIFFLR